MTSEQIKKAIKNHRQYREDYKRYERYYQGNNPAIQDKDAKEEPDNRIALAFGLKIVKTIIGYMFKEGLISFTTKVDEAKEFLEKLNVLFDYNNEHMTNTEIAESMLSKGKTYKLFYIKEEEINGVVKPGIIQWVAAEPDNIIVNWSSDLKPKMESVYYYYDSCDIDAEGNDVKKHHFYEYTKENINYSVAIDDDDYNPVDDWNSTNTVGEIPCIEFIPGKEKRSIFAHVISLIDQCDELISTNFANEHASIGNAVLMTSMFFDDQTKDANGFTDREKFLNARFKTIEGMSKEAGDFAEWLVKEVQWEGVFGAFDRIQRLIYSISSIPDFEDPTFTTPEAALAMQYRLTAFENLCSMIESYYKKSLHDQIVYLAKAMKATKDGDYLEYVDDIEIKFERNLPKSKKEAIENVQMLGITVSEQAKLQILHNADIIGNVEEEIQNKLDEAGTLSINDETTGTEKEGIDPNLDVDPTVVLNGAQITAALKIIEAMKAGTITKDTAISQIEIFFNISNEKAKRIVGDLS